MEKTVLDAQDFLNANKKKKITKTKTMVRTIAEAASMLNKNIKIKQKQTQKSAKKPADKKMKRKSIPAKPAMPSIPASIGTKLIPTKSKDKGPSKATIFKAPSRDSLPLPAFGFIDVCFCVDATGSMAS